MHEGEGSRRSPVLPYLLPVFFVGLAVLIVVWIFDTPVPSPSPKGNPVTPLPMMNTPFITPAVNQPPVSAAGDVSLPGDEVVIGVEESGLFRAYRLEAFRFINTHVVNDLMGNIPVSVTFCDRNDCVSVFTDKPNDHPLSLQVGGYNDKMFLKSGDGFFFQDDGTSIDANNPAVLPHQRKTFEKTTWKAWRIAHPTTSVYVGQMTKN
jgi:hypothetical protein